MRLASDAEAAYNAGGWAQEGPSQSEKRPMYRVTCQIDFCYGHRLLDYAGKCRHLHGHNGRAVIAVAAADLDHRGMVVDFTDIKREVRAWIDSHLDHRMILRETDPVVPFLQQLGEPLCLLPVNPTAEHIAKLIFDAAVARGFPIESVQMWETPRCVAAYVGARGEEKKGEEKK